MLKVAVACRFAVSVKPQVDADPLQAPLHPAKPEFVPGVSVRVTDVPELKLALHVGGQLIPVGLLDTVPGPLPARVTVNVGTLWFKLKVAVTCVFALRVTMQVIPLHAPPHPANDEFVPGVAVSVT
jgi:hypothetical protein